MLSVMAVLAVIAAVVVSLFAAHRSPAIPLITLVVLAAVYVLGLKVYPRDPELPGLSERGACLSCPNIANHINLPGTATAWRNGGSSRLPRTKSWTSRTSVRTYPRSRISGSGRGAAAQDYSSFSRSDVLSLQGRGQRSLHREQQVCADHVVPERVVLCRSAEQILDQRAARFHPRFRFGHGAVSGITKEGLPEFFIKDIPPVTSAGPVVNRPEIYYGESPNNY